MKSDNRQNVQHEDAQRRDKKKRDDGRWGGGGEKREREETETKEEKKPTDAVCLLLTVEVRKPLSVPGRWARWRGGRRGEDLVPGLGQDDLWGPFGCIWLLPMALPSRVQS